MPSQRNPDPAINRTKRVARGPSVGELSSQSIKLFISFTPPSRITFTFTDRDHCLSIPRITTLPQEFHSHRASARCKGTSILLNRFNGFHFKAGQTVGNGLLSIPLVYHRA